MRIAQAFLVLVVSAILWLFPVSEAVYEFKTDAREDTFPISIAASETSANMTLFRPIYDDDTSTVSLLSNNSNDIPVVSSYNGTSRVLLVGGLAENSTRS